MPGTLPGPGDSVVSKNVKDTTVMEFTFQWERLKINKEMNVCYVCICAFIPLGVMCVCYEEKQSPEKRTVDILYSQGKSKMLPKIVIFLHLGSVLLFILIYIT